MMLDINHLLSTNWCLKNKQIKWTSVAILAAVWKVRPRFQNQGPIHS